MKQAFLGAKKVCTAVSISPITAKNDAALEPQSSDDLTSEWFRAVARGRCGGSKDFQSLEGHFIRRMLPDRISIARKPMRLESFEHESDYADDDPPLTFASSARNFGVCKSDHHWSRRKRRLSATRKRRASQTGIARKRSSERSRA